VAKGVLVEAEGKPCIAVLAASDAVEPGRLAEALGARSVRLLTEHELIALFPDCEPGAEPPFGSLYGLRVVLDAALAREPRLVLRAGSHEETLELASADFVRLEHPTVASFAHAAPGRPAEELRGAPQGWPDGQSPGHA
jgi:Ala-tRNA(Pro) deacylase